MYWNSALIAVLHFAFAVKSSTVRNPTLHSEWKTAPSLQLSGTQYIKEADIKNKKCQNQ